MERMYATLSADVVDSTSLSAEDIIRLKGYLDGFSPIMKMVCKEAWGRVVRGDSMECVVPDMKKSLRIALLLKCYVRALDLMSASSLMKKKGIRTVVGLGSLRINDEQNGIIDGEAIYNSGRELDKLSGNDAISLVMVSGELNVNGYAALCDVLGFVLDQATSKQCAVLQYLLLGQTQMQVAKCLGLEQPTVNQHANAAGWNAIQRALNRFENDDFEKLKLK